MNNEDPKNKMQFVADILRSTEKSTWPTRTIARWLNENHFDIFPSVEGARRVIRRVVGTDGDKHRDKYKKQYGDLYDRQISYDAPVCYTDEYEPFLIPRTSDRMLLLSDVHVPFHDENVIRLAIGYGKDNGANALYLNGDISDQYWVSHFVKMGHRHPFTYQQELDAMMWFLDWMQDEFDGMPIYYKLGNHEQRFEAYLGRVPELRGIDYFSLPTMLKLRERGITVIEPNVYANYGKLKIAHGHEWGSGRSSPVNMARGLCLKAKQSAICGHGHTTSEHSATKMDNSIITCWSVGCCCDLHPPYRPLNENNHGFAFLKLHGDRGGFTVDNKRVYRDEIM